ncbi:MAG: Holliday junction resolvase RuvX [Minisyncoccia bacterium]
MGIDYGKKRVGIAISDEDGKMAFPKDVLTNDAKLLARIKKYCDEQKIGMIVLGESNNFQGQPNKIMKDVEPFKIDLWEETGLPIEYELEYLTSHQVENIFGKTKMLDASAASIILQSYLDKINLKK